MELGIKGHKTRGDEVVKILEMLGGNNSYIGPDEIEGYEIFSLEDFLEKFPYKVGDKVEVWVNHEHFAGPRAELEVAEIKSMRWNSARCEVAYRMKNATGEFYVQDIKGKVDDGSNKQSECEQCGRVFGSVRCFDVDCSSNTPNYAEGLKDDKVNGDENIFHTTNEYEEIVENSFQGGYEKCKSDHQIEWLYDLPDGYHFADENGNVIDAKKIRLVKNTPYYPKSYDECCDVLSMCYATLYNLRYHTYEHGYYEFTTSDKLCSLQDKLNILGKLLICRDAYWKIAGEELGLNKPWEPDFSDDSPKYNIFKYENKITLSDNNWSNRILVFPTLEMRNAFYENFKDLIEQCKELL